MTCDPEVFHCVTEVVVRAEDWFFSVFLTAVACFVLGGYLLCHAIGWLERRFPRWFK